MAIEKLKTVNDRHATLGEINIFKSDFRYLARSPIDLASRRRAPAFTYAGAGEVRVAASEDLPAGVLMTGFPNINHPGQFTSGELQDSIILANALKATMNSHAADATEHPGGADIVNFPVATADASNLTTLVTLVGDLLTAYAGHDDDAEDPSPTYHQATEAADHSIWAGSAPTDLPGCIEWLNELKVRYNAHDADATAHDVGSAHQESTADAPLTDGYYRVNVADTSMNFATGTTFWGSEKASQWYAVYAVAASGDTDFTLKAMPWMRYSSQAGQVITLRNNLNSADIGYGLTTDELVGGQILVIKGTSRGLVRPITANNNNNTTGGTITYGGSALTMTQGDWFIVLPPGTNFRWLGDVYNTSGSAIAEFVQEGDMFSWEVEVSMALGASATTERVAAAPPLATRVILSGIPAATSTTTPQIRRNSTSASYMLPYFAPSPYTGVGFTLPVPIEFCSMYANGGIGIFNPINCLEFHYPSGMLG